MVEKIGGGEGRNRRGEKESGTLSPAEQLDCEILTSNLLGMQEEDSWLSGLEELIQKYNEEYQNQPTITSKSTQDTQKYTKTHHNLLVFAGFIWQWPVGSAAWGEAFKIHRASAGGSRVQDNAAEGAEGS